ncbi:MAG TPA: hypothetical protein VLF20_06070 [Patescibacteria group bacterium]|nr:hypothetical protein [Patescibacteria group bacterium]
MKESQIANRKEQKNFLRFFLGFSFVVLFSVFSFTFYVSSAVASTGINNQINFQGRLVDADGLLVADSTYSVVFTLYDAASGGTTLWSETQNVATVDGRFQVALGSITSLSGVNFNSDSIYLGITVENDAEMTPRIRFAAVAYAFNAHMLNGVTATQSANGFTISGGTSTQKVLGINNSLTFAGNDGMTITFQGTDTYVGRTTIDVLTNKTIGSTGLTFSGATTDITTATDEDFVIAPDGLGETIILSGGNTAFVVGQSGNINIGTQSASVSPYKLYVSTYEPATAAAMIENTAALSGGTSEECGVMNCSVGLMVKMGAPGSDTNAGSTDRFLQFMRGDGLVVGKFQGNGTSGVSYTSSGADYAEYFRKEFPEEVLSPGDLVCLGLDGGVTACTQMNKGIVGVISDRAIVIGNDHEGDPNYVIVGLIGQLGVKVVNSNGSIQSGDPLTFSDIPGVAIKATTAGEIIGRATASYTEESFGELGIVSASVSRSWYDPANAFTSLDGFRLEIVDATSSARPRLVDNVGQTISELAAFSDVIIGNIRTGYVIAEGTIAAGALEARQITTDALTVTTDNIFLGGLTLREHIVQIVHDTLREQRLEETAGTGLTFSEAGVIDLESRITNLETFFSSSSAHILTDSSGSLISSQEQQTAPSPVDYDDNLTTVEGLEVNGIATISSHLRVQANTLVEGVLTVIDTLMTRNFISNGLATFFDTVVFKGDVVFAQQPTFSKDTAGFAIVRKGADQVTVSFDKQYKQTPVVNASISLEEMSKSITPLRGSDEDAQSSFEEAVLGSNITYIVTKRTTKGFTILLQQPAQEDLTFAWTAFSVSDPIVFTSMPTPVPTISALEQSLAGDASLSAKPIQAGKEVSEDADSNP